MTTGRKRISFTDEQRRRLSIKGKAPRNAKDAARLSAPPPS